MAARQGSSRGILKKNRKQAPKAQYFDYTLLFVIIILLAFGLIMLYSVSSYEAQSSFGNSFYYLKNQGRAAAIGFIFMLICSRIDYHKWKKLAFPLYLLVFLACVAVIFVGNEYGGQKRWFSIAGISVQPSEFAKVAIIVTMATVLCGAAKKLAKKEMPRHYRSKLEKTVKQQIMEIWKVIRVCLVALPIIVPIAYNNLSTALIIVGIVFIMVLVVSPKYSPFLILIAAAVIAIFLYLSLGSGYRAVRFLAWIHPEQYPDDTFQTLQGLYAIGSGGLFGKGLGASMQKLGFVPEAENDMIFSIICEELGLFGAICMILLFVLMIWRFLVIANNAPDLFGSLLVVGIMAHISLQVLLNIAVVTNTIPNTGVTLPFISFGGTSLMILLVEMGIALSVSRGIRLEETPDE